MPLVAARTWTLSTELQPNGEYVYIASCAGYRPYRSSIIPRNSHRLHASIVARNCIRGYVAFWHSFTVTHR